MFSGVESWLAEYKALLICPRAGCCMCLYVSVGVLHRAEMHLVVLLRDGWPCARVCFFVCVPYHAMALSYQSRETPLLALSQVKRPDLSSHWVPIAFESEVSAYTCLSLGCLTWWGCWPSQPGNQGQVSEVWWWLPLLRPLDILTQMHLFLGRACCG